MTEIENLLEHGADPNTKDANGFTLLMSFAKKNDPSSVRSLLNHGAKMDTKDVSGLNALDYAIKANALAAIKVLIEYSCPITSDNYMLAINKNMKEIVSFFDTLDENKQIWLKDKKR
jgi:ankyrin repeat protein